MNPIEISNQMNKTEQVLELKKKRFWPKISCFSSKFEQKIWYTTI